MSNPPPRIDPGTPHGGSGLGPREKDAFWSVVVDCLVEFHRMHRPRAQEAALSLRNRLESPPPGISGEMIYHDEPFYVACDIAGTHDSSMRGRLLIKNRAKYDSILALGDW